MKKLITFYINATFFMMINFVFADIVSKDPNYLKRGKIEKVHIANYLKKELRKHNYTIIKDPTGISPFKLIENFSPRKGDCGTAGHFWRENNVKIGTGTTDCNSNRLRLEVASSGDIRIGNKAKEIWVGYYFYVPNIPGNLEDKFLQPYITQFYSINRKGGQTVGGYAPQFSASIYNGKLSIEGNHVIDEKNLKGKWHKVEFNIRYSKKYDGFIKVYINNELKINRSGFKTASHDYVDIKYGTYSHPEYGGAMYPEGYQFPSHTIYFAGFSLSNERKKLLVNKIQRILD